MGCEGLREGETGGDIPVASSSALTLGTTSTKTLTPITLDPGTLCLAGDPDCGGTRDPVFTDVAPDNGCSTSGSTTTCTVTFIHNGSCETQTTTCTFDGTKNTCKTTFVPAVPQAGQCK